MTSPGEPSRVGGHQLDPAALVALPLAVLAVRLAPAVAATALLAVPDEAVDQGCGPFGGIRQGGGDPRGRQPPHDGCPQLLVQSAVGGDDDGAAAEAAAQHGQRGGCGHDVRAQRVGRREVLRTPQHLPYVGVPGHQPGVKLGDVRQPLRRSGPRVVRIRIPLQLVESAVQFRVHGSTFRPGAGVRSRSWCRTAGQGGRGSAAGRSCGSGGVGPVPSTYDHPVVLFLLERLPGSPPTAPGSVSRTGPGTPKSSR